MKITLLGTGTSQGVPVIGCDCPVCQSDHPKDKRLRVACMISDDTTTVVIDVGPDFRQQMLRAKVRKLDAVLITHEHNDHTAGVDDLRSFNFRQGFDMPIYANSQVITDLQQRFAYAFAPNRYPGAPSFDCREIEHSHNFFVQSLAITPIRVWHGKLPILGFRIGNFAYLTDVKRIEDAELEKLQNLKVLIISAIHYSEHHAHLNIPEAIALIEKLKPQQTYFTHISHNLGLHEVVNPTLPPNIALAYDGLEFIL
jgi:phosphoribosyl 1,2-cyclic phosphate phosphodiesterase